MRIDDAITQGPHESRKAIHAVGINAVAARIREQACRTMSTIFGKAKFHKNGGEGIDKIVVSNTNFRGLGHSQSELVLMDACAGAASTSVPIEALLPYAAVLAVL